MEGRSTIYPNYSKGYNLEELEKAGHNYSIMSHKYNFVNLTMGINIQNMLKEFGILNGIIKTVAVCKHFEWFLAYVENI